MTARATSDCVVIGAGVIGCAIAWRLARRGLKPLVVDPQRPGQQASQAAAGILGPQIESEGQGAVLDLGLAARAQYPTFVAELEAETGMHVGYVRSGLLQVAGDDDAELALLAARLTWNRRAGLTVEALDAQAIAQLEPGLGPCTRGLHFPDEAQLEPPRLVRALELGARRAGASFIQAHALRIEEHGGAVAGVCVREEGREHVLSAPQAVLAAGSWSSQLAGVGLGPDAVYPMRGQALDVLLPEPQLRHIVFGRGGYLVPRADGRIYVGATMEPVGYQQTHTLAGVGQLLALAQRLAPSLASATLERIWVGLRPFTTKHRPLLGPTHLKGLYLATGHCRNGILHCPITATAIAALVLGEAPPLDLSPFAAP